MKKTYLFIAAAAGLMLTACSEDNLQVDNAAVKQDFSDVAVGFDTYLSSSNNSKTRAGLTDVMTNAKLQKEQGNQGGFGVFASHHNATITKQSIPYDGGRMGDWNEALTQTEVTPDFMWNQGVFYTISSWGYSPLKYWPNETWNDSQEGGSTGNPAWTQNSTDTPPAAVKGTTRDRVSFFAYAPYVNFAAGAGTNYPSEAANPAASQSKYPAVNTYDSKTSYSTDEEPDYRTGILAVTGNTYKDEAPKVYYRVNYNGYTNGTAPTTLDEGRKPEESVDLLWGVAPAGDLVYTAVNGQTVKADEGMPLYNLEKPAKDEKIKFLFQHALSRLSLSVVAAVDQIGPGGSLDGSQTKITVEKVTVNGKFNTGGWLWLDNQYKNRARWDYGTGTAPLPTYYQHVPNAIRSSNPLFIMSNNKLKGEDGNGTDDGNNLLNETIWDKGVAATSQPEGVLTSEKALMAAQVNPDKVENNGTSYAPTFKVGTSEWIKNANGNAEEATATWTTNSTYYTIVSSDKYSINSTISMKGSDKQGTYYSVTKSDSFTGDGTEDFKTKTGASDYSTPIIVWKEKTVGTITTYEKITISSAGEDKATEAGVTYYKTFEPALVADGTMKTALETHLTYASSIYYSGTLPRYWMVIPAYYTGTDTQPTDVTVQITYYVTTDDAQLSKTYSRVQNVVEKTIPVKFESGKSYNLKLILGLTSVKLAAEVADWKVDGDTEVNLPQNVE